MKAMVNGRILLSDREMAGKALLFDDRIAGVVDEAVARREAEEIIDAAGAYVCPGLVDVHIHGYLGADTSDGDMDGIRKMAAGVVANGVTSFLPTSYTYRTDPKELCGAWRSRVQKRHLDDFLIPFGYGDGGGGPCRDYIEYAQRERDLEGMPKVKMASPTEFFEDLERKGGPVNTWDGELYFNAHRGTYTTQAAVKKNNRRSEFALHNLEVWGALAALKGAAYPAADA